MSITGKFQQLLCALKYPTTGYPENPQEAQRRKQVAPGPSAKGYSPGALTDPKVSSAPHCIL